MTATNARRLAIASALVFQACVAGCAIQNHGSIVSRVIHTDSAVVVDSFALGAWARGSRDRSLILGFARERDVHPKSVERHGTSRWVFFEKPLDEHPPLLDTRIVVGGLLDASRYQAGASLGYLSEALLIPLAPDESRILCLTFDPERLARTRVHWSTPDATDLDSTTDPNLGGCE